LLHPVHLRLAEAEGSLTVEAEVPGFTAKDLEVNLESGRLTISGKRHIEEKHKDKKTVYIYTERCADQVLRVIDLPAKVNASNAKATLRDGILQVTMQKANAVKNVRVDVKVAWLPLRLSRTKVTAALIRIASSHAAFGYELSLSPQ
jgi:HSP20 family protein